MINVEKLAFPSGIAAAETLRSLHAKSKQATLQAYALVSTMVVGGIIGFMREAKVPVLDTLKLRLSDIPLSASSQNLSLSQLPGFAFPTSALLIGAGMIVGLRVSASMLFGACLLYTSPSPRDLSTSRMPSSA